jgi:glutathionylspermidine synthase
MALRHDDFLEMYARNPAAVRNVQSPVAGYKHWCRRSGDPYGDQACVYQELKPLRRFDGNYAVIGSWMVNGYACGIGIREDRGPVTGNTSRFVPHFFVP